VFLRCLRPSHCEGGDGSVCGKNREGPLCALCKTGYYATNMESECTPCPSRDTSLGLSVFISLLVIAAVVVLFVVFLRTSNQTNERRVSLAWLSRFACYVVNSSSSACMFLDHSKAARDST
jgi:hypothetical protein